MIKLIILLGISIASAAQENPPTQPQKNCIIISTSEYFDGEIKKDVNSFDFKTKKECEDIKKTYSNNFSPKEIKKFSVKMEWKGK